VSLIILIITHLSILCCSSILNILQILPSLLQMLG